jgi:hypothetical protein
VKYPDFEKAVLALAFETDTKLTPSAVAYHLECSIDDARQHLETLLYNGGVTLESDADGNLYYEVPLREGGSTSGPAKPQAAIEAHRTRTKIALGLNLLLPGSGSMLVGRTIQGLGQAAIAVTMVTLTMLFWKDFGCSEHQPWLILLGAFLIGSIVWGVRTVLASFRGASQP